jgi:conjugal transfer pilus assembly protein TraW
MSSVKCCLFSSLLAASLCCAVAAFAGDAGAYSSVMRVDRLPAGTLKAVSNAISQFQKPLPKEDYQDVTKQSERVMDSIGNLNPKTFSLKDYYKDDGKLPAAGCSGHRPKASALYYFFSFSMPEERIKEMMIESAKDGAVMVLTGLYHDTIEATAAKLRQIAGNRSFPVDIDPTLFEDYDIRVVPTVLRTQREGKEGIWRMEGDVSLQYAVKKFSQSPPGDIGLVGPTWPIAETDMLTLIKRKLRTMNWHDLGRRIFKHAFVYKGEAGISTATAARTYYMDPSGTLSQDIKDGEGRVVFPAGTTFNPLDYVPLDGKFIVIDGNDPAQVKLALKGRYREIILTQGDLRRLIARYEKPFYVADAAFIGRFGISAVPAVISEEGRLIKIEEIVPPKK